MAGDVERVFHLAIPCRDLEEARGFYVDGLGCRLARSYDDRITLEFFGHQVVCHLSPGDSEPEPRPYPRHFGITFRRRDEFDAVAQLARDRGLRILADPSRRFPGRPEEHETFFLVDPSNNVIEFKWYLDARHMY
ncbi:MAG TPA: VOC family protein [Gemmatimonadota bacterium]|jgi:extradiol dioxygenase family protein